MPKSRKADVVRGPTRYVQIIERIFRNAYKAGAQSVPFTRQQIEEVASELGIKLPKNLGDVVYTFRYRAELPQFISSKAPKGHHWIIAPVGRSRYAFQVSTTSTIRPGQNLAETKIPDATPGLIAKYAFSDEQALLAKLRYNRLIDTFTCVTCYSLQSHLRSVVTDLGQIETDEVYIGVDKRGAHYVFPIQAKVGGDRISIVQIMQDFGLCHEKFPGLICRPIAAQFMQEDVIALFEFERSKDGVAVNSEKHYRLVHADEVSADDLQNYAARRD